jgi:hypothetical protein
MSLRAKVSKLDQGCDAFISSGIASYGALGMCLRSFKQEKFSETLHNSS